MKLIGALLFDSGTTFEEYSKITVALLKLGYVLTISERFEDDKVQLPYWSAQQVEIHKREQ